MEKPVSNYVIQSLWIGDTLSNVEKLCIKSFLDYGHDFHLYCYDQIANVPKGTKLFDASKILSREAIFQNKKGWGGGSFSGFADFFRILLLQAKGGWWVDMDIICLKEFDFAEDLIICSSYEGEYGAIANNCVIKAAAGNKFINHCANELSKFEPDNLGFGAAGPFLFQRLVKELDMKEKIVPYYTFNPINWKNVGELILSDRSFLAEVKELIRPIFKPSTMVGRKILPQSFAVHFWNEVWRNHPYDKNATYPRHSVFEKLKKKHGV
ncbi:hypothetical protein EZ449_14410 [Pedobacter frigidisoli]|uniref:Alpha 1,4-glycosyltransferase domain-containing protein n=1 Tax=Pedobacter frigidisoli TaxID=2530455 RepID=A0A4R0P2D5_9SPHI|nr:glycosyltransferase [Pedobacter frigidisoli]TCD07722.1 hypothetical protein EZ449_14410 [Pedobacter frigidisoli]